MSKRFISEFGLNMMATACVVLQDEDLERLPQLLPEDAPPFHIYMIGTRPRVSLDPNTFRSNVDTFSGTFEVQLESERRKFPFEWPYPPQGKFDRLESPWPHTTFAFMRGDDWVLRGKTAILAAGEPTISDLLDLDILYIGQSFGEAGERQAPQRLASHSTLQRILGEVSRRHPDREVWLALAHFEQILLGSFDGRIAKTPGALADDEGRIERVLSQEVSEQQAINFTEAALIRYFAPRYNKTFRNTFPSTTHTSYRECYDLDLNMVSVELSTEVTHVRLRSEQRNSSWLHLPQFPLHDPTERQAMLDLLLPPA